MRKYPTDRPTFRNPSARSAGPTDSPPRKKFGARFRNRSRHGKHLVYISPYLTYIPTLSRVSWSSQHTHTLPAQSRLTSSSASLHLQTSLKGRVGLGDTPKGPPQIHLTRSGGRVHRFPRLVRPWHTLGELRRSQFRVSGAAHAVDNADSDWFRGPYYESCDQNRCCLAASSQRRPSDSRRLS